MQRITLVTGGSRGIGAATALRCAEAGHAVAVNYARDAAAAKGIVAQIERSGGRAVAVQADVSSAADIERMFQTVDRELGMLTALVNNAGVIDVVSRVDEMDEQRLTRMFAVNVVGTFLCARQALRRMSTRHGGSGGAIVNLSSAGARLGSPGQYVDYAASKGAIDTFTLGVAREVATEGVRVNAVRPGIIDTEIHASGGQADRVAQSLALMPMKRAGTADEVARAIVWLLSDDASYTTGAVLDVTGGR